ncbi:MAG: PD-(D/E)XK nuclease family protein [Pedobacter sp.]|nr:PD-(D/E)XK nuclease family protein [Pedobacter sp.]MDQ8054487.1 PD-(D/E)XK nuclease family protein [Pedobacter sp.]
MKPFLQDVAEDLVAKFGANLQDCAIVFNNKRPAAYLQKHLADLIKKPFWSPAFFTVQEFFATATTLKIADPYTQFFALYDCYVALLRAEGMEKIPSLSRFHHLAKIILSDFSQIDNDLVDQRRLFTELEDIATINQQFDFLTAEQKEFLAQFWQSYSEGKYKRQQELFIRMWNRMPTLYDKFHARLAEDGYMTMAMLYRKIADQHFDETFVNGRVQGKLIFVGFNALSRAEAKAFKRWQDEGKAIFYFDIDTYYLEDEMQEAGLFLRRNLKQIGLVNQLSNDSSYIKAHQRNVGIYKVQGQTAQAKIVNELLVDELKAIADGQEVQQTAIVLADESLLMPLIQTIPSATANLNQVPVNITMGFALNQSTLYGLSDLWLNAQLSLLQRQWVGYQTVEAFLSHPLTGISEAMRSKIFNSLIENQLTEIPAERLIRQGGLLATFFTPVRSSANAVTDLTELLNKILQRELAARNLKKIDADLFSKTLQELNRLHDTLQQHLVKYQQPIELSFVLSLIQKSLSAIAVPLAGDPLNGLQVMGLLESRNLNFDKVIVLGVNEGMVPKTGTGNTFIPDSLRRAYGLPVLENQDAISAYMFYRLVQRAEKIELVYNSLTDESNSGEPSRFIKQLEYESGFAFAHRELQLAVKTAAVREEVILKTEKVQQELQKYLSGERVLSASALTTYISNPIDFFYKYIAGIAEPQEVEETVEAYKIGLILHDVMEQFYAQLMRESPDITKERIHAKRAAVPELIMQAFAEELHGNRTAPVLLNGMQKVVYAIILEYVQLILAQDESDAPFTLVGLEQKGSVAFSFPANGSQQQIKLYGIIDRVDLKNGIHRIVDYKTGNDQLKYSSMEDCFDTDCGNINKALVQTMFYTYVYEQVSKNSQVEPNLYVVKTMSKDGVSFMRGKDVLSNELLALEKTAFVKALELKLSELFDFNIPFKISKNPKNYPYSIYTTLFGK